jgi:methionyl-tRNA formyltransferase
MRGPSPIRSSLLTNAPDAVGVTIMLIDTKMDHGPILAQKKITPQQWPLPGRELDALLIERGAQLLAETVPQYIDGTLKPKEQEHDQATYCKMFSKEDARIDLNGDPHVNLFKIAAYDEWPGAYTFIERSEKQVRVKIVSAHIESNTLVLDRIVPEGKSEMNYSDFIRAQ